MYYEYSDPNRESEPTSLPDIEVFYWTKEEAYQYFSQFDDDGECDAEPGWYYWYCFPGCMPDSEANGPYKTKDAAIADARSYND